MPVLYIVGTPIGNLSDISKRAVKTLQNADFIAAEDTRVTGKLLNHLGIKKPMVSYYQHNLRERGREIIARIIGGESCALVSDAGMPAVSDPGEDLVRLAIESGVKIEMVPGPTAVITALCLSGLPTGRFSFEGFLSVNRTAREEHLKSVKNMPHTLLFYEAPHKLPNTLSDMARVLGGGRRCAVIKELTKIHETALRLTLGEAEIYFHENSPKGEYVIVIEGEEPMTPEKMELAEAVSLVSERSRSGVSLSSAAKEIAEISGYKKSELYKLAVSQAGEEE